MFSGIYPDISSDTSPAESSDVVYADISPDISSGKYSESNSDISSDILPDISCGKCPVTHILTCVLTFALANFMWYILTCILTIHFFCIYSGPCSGRCYVTLGGAHSPGALHRVEVRCTQRILPWQAGLCHRGAESILSPGVIHIRKGMFPVNKVEILVDAELVIRFPGWHVAGDFLDLPKSKDLPQWFLDLSSQKAPCRWWWGCETHDFALFRYALDISK